MAVAKAVDWAGGEVKAGSLIFMGMWKHLSSLFEELLVQITEVWIGDNDCWSMIRLVFYFFI